MCRSIIKSRGVNGIDKKTNRDPVFLATSTWCFSISSKRNQIRPNMVFFLTRIPKNGKGRFTISPVFNWKNVVCFEFSTCRMHFFPMPRRFFCRVHDFHHLFLFFSPLSSSSPPSSLFSPLLPSLSRCLCCRRFLCLVLSSFSLFCVVATGCCCCRRCSWVLRVLERLLFVSWQMFAISLDFLRHSGHCSLVVRCTLRGASRARELVITMMMDADDCSNSL